MVVLRRSAPRNAEVGKNRDLWCAAYFISPIDAIPDVTPLVGFTDDLGALAAAIAMTSAYINEDVKRKTSEKLLSWFGSN